MGQNIRPPVLRQLRHKMKVSFSLANSKTKTTKPVGAAPSLKRPAAFASLGDDEPIDAAPTSVGISSNAGANKLLVAQGVLMSKAMKKRMEEEKKIDATVFEYDEVWDKMQDAKQRQKEAKEVDAKERKVRTSSSPSALGAGAKDSTYSSPSTSITCLLLRLPGGWTISELKRR